ncbi:MAG TPA: MEDS domain-containing protein [bacterium]|nr:MEDS domain-containing protein [bacterium]
MRNRRLESAETKPGDHVILLYENTAELFGFVVPFVTQGLANGERCVYVAAESTPADVIDALAAAGVPVARETKRGAFALMTPREYFGLPPLDPGRAIEQLQRRVTEAVSTGFAGLRVADEMTWAGTEGVAEEILGEYEALLETILGSGRVTLACIYRRDRFDPVVLERQVRTYGKVVADDYVYLSLSALFRNLARTDLEGLARSARERTVRKGELFFRQGEEATDVFFLTAGTVKLERTDADGQNVVLRIIAPMQPFGERVLAFGGGVRLASAEALEDSRALAWDGSALLQFMLAHPAVPVNAIRVLEERVEAERSRLEDFASPDVRRRLARLFLRLGRHVGRQTRRGAVLNVALSRRDLAELAIASPYTVSRILAEWRRLDILDAQRTRIVIRDRDRLAAIAEQRVSRSTARSKIS